MRVAVSADSGDGLDSVVSPHFGRCPYFVLVGVDGKNVTAVESIANPFYGNHQPGQVPGFIHSQEANVMLTGGMGMRAITFFEQCGIETATGAAGSVRRALEQYLGGELQGAAPCRESIQHAHGHDHEESEYERDDIGRLREEAEALQQQLDQVMRRLDQAGGGE
jgi:predicted Fe-Mo cluster-binding NifX family protein